MPRKKTSEPAKTTAPRMTPMVPGRMTTLPKVFGDTPSFLGVDLIHVPDQVPGHQIVFMGVPIEGAVTWGSYSGCELTT
ncbi:MAG: hypothetical protein HQK55_06500, partial [Deltaproteobacteria bacterium]|nr:hypothetical protein [Deltaproteobacteria bacterium]